MKTPTSDAGTPLRSKGGREIIHVKTTRGVVPFSVKRRNIDIKGGGKLHGVKVKGGNKR